MLADESNLIIHQALDARNRGVLGYEVREAHLDMAGLRLQAARHLAQHFPERLNADLTLMPIEYFHEARHVRALEMRGQIHVHVEPGNGMLFTARTVLDPHRMKNVLDTDFIDGNTPRIRRVLDVGNHAPIEGNCAAHDITSTLRIRGLACRRETISSSLTETSG